jgi:general secretion pathway protein D
MKNALKIQFLTALIFCTTIFLIIGCTGLKESKDTGLQPVASAPKPSIQTASQEIQQTEVPEDELDQLRNSPFGNLIRNRKPVKAKTLDKKTSKPVDKAAKKRGPDNRTGDRPPETAGPKAKKVTRQAPKNTETLMQKEPPKEISSKEASFKSAPAKGDIVLNFDNADLYEIVRVLADLLQINYIVDPNVRGRVTIHTAGALKKEDLFPIFYQILEANGLTAVKEGSLYKILRLKEAPQMPLPTVLGDSQEDLPPGERIIIQIIPLEYISIEEMSKLLTPFVTAGGTIIPYKGSNTLVLVDKTSNIPKLLGLVRIFDVNLFENVHYRFFPLKYVNAEEISKPVKDFVDAFFGSSKVEYRIIPLERVNSLLLISKNDMVFDKIEMFIKQVDISVEDVEPRIYVYSVRNGQADELSSLLGNVFSKSNEKDKKPTTVNQQEATEEKKTIKSETPPLFPSDQTKPAERKKTGEIVVSEGASTLKGEVKITPDTIRNALIIEATPRDYRIVENILLRLDVLPRQVLIELTIAEVTLDSETELGVEWSYTRNDSVGDDKFVLQDLKLSSAGLNFLYYIDQANNWFAAVSALAKQDKVNILSSPSVLASDNKEARIDISREIPIASSEYNFDPGVSSVVQTNIQYRNTGVILSVTPHINEYGLVSMDVNQEFSEQAEAVPISEGDARPSFFKRTVNTTLTVRTGQTIVIGGLMKETTSKGYAGLPCVGDVPVLSYLTGTKQDVVDKTELIIFITPYVIASLHDIDMVSEEFRKKLGYDPADYEYQPYKLKTE